MRRRRIAILSFVVLAGAAARATATYWPRPLTSRARPLIPAFQVVEGRARVSLPGMALIARVGEYRRELPAYLMFDHLRGAKSSRGLEALLTCKEVDGQAIYSLLLVLPDDLLEAIPRLVELKRRGLIGGFEWQHVAPEVLARPREQTSFFMSAYGPAAARRRLELLPAEVVREGAGAFLEFKSRTDPRIRNRIEPLPRALSPEHASEFAADIVAVAGFYSIPLDFFVGIGAMENNFMNVPGDLANTAWKARPEKGDVVLKRRRGKVLVRNDSLGPWQITRETLRYAHRLYLQDRRDYTSLPERLRPDQTLDFDLLKTRVLTTYAGLIFRDLIDRFDGDVRRAVGAYNGGVRSPNARYETGVRLVADYFRSTLERAAERKALRTPHAPAGITSGDASLLPLAAELRSLRPSGGGLCRVPGSAEPAAGRTVPAFARRWRLSYNESSESPALWPRTLRSDGAGRE